MPRVLNATVATPSLLRRAVYVGRPTKWGNPFKISEDGTREEVIEKYRWRGERIGLDLEARAELRGKDLVCWCAPLPCHADVLLEWANGPTK
jgi:hypothetical protein